jgi:hypothetical protein
VSALATSLPADHVHTQGPWHQGVTYSQSLGDLSENMASEVRSRWYTGSH